MGTSSRVSLLATDSTLACIASSSLGLTRYGRVAGQPELTPAQLVERLPELREVANVEPGPYFYISSEGETSLGPGIWRKLANSIQEILQGDPGLAGAVVVHGTNSLEEAAYFLNLTVQSEKPVVVVGAQRPWNAISSDGPMNLFNAIRVAAYPGSAGRGVLVLLNDTIHAAREVTKSNTYRVETFQSPNSGPLGTVDPDAVVFYRRPERRHTLRTEFDLARIGEFPRVDILYAYGGVDGQLVGAAVHLGAKGLVIAGTGNGWVEGMEAALERAMRDGVVVVRSSRAGSGRVLANDNTNSPNFLVADNLNPQKARILLMLALTRTRNPSEVQRIFGEY